MMNPLPWYDGNIKGRSHVWDANDQEVDLMRYTSMIVDAVNVARPQDTLLGRIARWLRQEPSP